MGTSNQTSEETRLTDKALRHSDYAEVLFLFIAAGKPALQQMNDLFRKVSQMARKGKTTTNGRPEINWKTVTWHRPSITSEHGETISGLLESGDFDPSSELDDILTAGTHVKATLNDKGLINLSATFFVDTESGGNWHGTSAASTTFRNALIVLLFKIDLVIEQCNTLSQAHTSGIIFE